MGLGQGREATLFSFTGSLLLFNPERLHRGFKAEVLGLEDSASGLTARSTWTDERGDKVYSELQRQRPRAGTKPFSAGLSGAPVATPGSPANTPSPGSD